MSKFKIYITDQDFGNIDIKKVIAKMGRIFMRELKMRMR